MVFMFHSVHYGLYGSSRAPHKRVLIFSIFCGIKRRIRLGERERGRWGKERGGERMRMSERRIYGGKLCYTRFVGFHVCCGVKKWVWGEKGEDGPK